MGQEVHRQGLIAHTTLQGNSVVAELNHCDDFAMAIFEMNLQMSYPDAHMVVAVSKYTPLTTKVVEIHFSNPEDALHFVLSH
jgi:hypothetical protein